MTNDLATENQDNNDYGWKQIDFWYDRKLRLNKNIFVLCINILVVLICFLLDILLDPDRSAVKGFSWLIVLASLVVIFPLHEFIHALALPAKLSSGKVHFGVFLKIKFLPMLYVAYDGEMRKARYIVVLLAPFVTLTVIPMTVMLLFHIHNYFLYWVVCWNATGAIRDISMAVESLWKLPKNSIIYGDYWREG